MQVHAPWALAVNARIRERLGVEGSAVASDDGIIARVPDAAAEPPGAELFVFEPDELEQIVTDEVGGSALFASRFRECAARALLMPRLQPGPPQPAVAAAPALGAAARGGPPLPDVPDHPRDAPRGAAGRLRRARAAAHRPQHRRSPHPPGRDRRPSQPSPFARDLLFGYVGAFMYEGDSPLAERRAAALSVDPALLSELLGRVEMRELLDPDVIAQFEREAQRLDPERRARGVEGVADLLRMLGPLDAAEVAARLAARPIAERRATRPRRSTPRRAAPRSCRAAAPRRTRRRAPRDPGDDRRASPRVAAIEDAGRLRDALGVALPVGIPNAFLEPLADPLGDLVARYARTHGPFTSGRRRRAARRRRRRRAAHAAAPRVAGPRRERLLPARRSTDAGPVGGGRDRVVRRRGAAAAADAVARGDPRQRRAGLARGVRAVPAGLAARRPPARGHRRRRRGDRAARRRADPGERVGVARPAGARRATTPRRCSTSSPRPAR